MTDDFRSENYFANYRLTDGILTVEFKPDVIIDLRVAKKVVQGRHELVRGKSYPTMIIINNDYLLLEKNAYRYLGSAEGVKYMTAGAIVINSPLRRILTNFQLTFYKQKVPLRVFSSKSDAKLWLLNYIEDREEVDR